MGDMKQVSYSEPKIRSQVLTSLMKEIQLQ